MTCVMSTSLRPTPSLSCCYRWLPPYSICAPCALKRRRPHDHCCRDSKGDYSGFSRSESHSSAYASPPAFCTRPDLPDWYLDLAVGTHPDLIHSLNCADHAGRGAFLSEGRFALYP